MQPIDLASATASAIHDIPSKFMVDPATYATGAELGYAGMDFYYAGRGGVLGDVDGDVVAAAFIFFEPSAVRAAWQRTASIGSRAQAAAQFADLGYEWARNHLHGDDLDVIVSLAGKVVDEANPACAPLFAAWRCLPVPEDRAAAALHRLNALRELRAALHGAAVLTSGLTPVEAMAHHNPGMASLFGWPDPLPQVTQIAPLWDRAEDATDIAMGTPFSVLSETESEQLASACAFVLGQIKG